MEEMEKYDFGLQERFLFHVARIRARDTLTITSFGMPSMFFFKKAHLFILDQNFR